MSVQKLGAKWTYRNLYGFSDIVLGDNGPERIIETEKFAGALCNAIAGDGEASPKEILWVQGLLAAKMFPDEVVKKVPEMAKNSEGKSLDQIAKETKEMMQYGTLKFAGLAISYHAIEAAAQDGLDDAEVKAIKVIANVLSVSDEQVDDLVNLYKEQEAFLQKKINKMLPNGHPNLDPKYAGEGMVSASE